MASWKPTLIFLAENKIPLESKRFQGNMPLDLEYNIDKTEEFTCNTPSREKGQCI